MKKRIITLFVIIYNVLTANGQDLTKRIDCLIETAVKINRFHGSVLVSKNGKIVYEKATDIKMWRCISSTLQIG
jgi:hypothetical protein